MSQSGSNVSRRQSARKDLNCFAKVVRRRTQPVEKQNLLIWQAVNRNVGAVRQHCRAHASARGIPHLWPTGARESDGAGRGNQQTAEQRRIAELLGGNANEIGRKMGDQA